MMGLSLSHLLMVSLVILFFGGRRIPEAAAGLGKGLREFRAALSGHQGLEVESKPEDKN